MPSGLNATPRTLLACPRHVASSAPVAASQSRAVRSSPPEARRVPSGLKANDQRFVAVAFTDAVSLPDVASHNREPRPRRHCSGATPAGAVRAHGDPRPVLSGKVHATDAPAGLVEQLEGPRRATTSDPKPQRVSAAVTPCGFLGESAPSWAGRRPGP